MQLLFSNSRPQYLHLRNRKQASHDLKKWFKSPEVLYALLSEGIKLSQTDVYIPHTTSNTSVNIHTMVEHSLSFCFM